ncbi:MAG: transcriptional repressor [Cyclobacteriaceae bacterium]|nr:transcriptional repressor [Cyclobacteriaceae bacterium]
MTAQEARKQLMEVGLKATQQRIVVLMKMRNMDSHPTADQVFEYITAENPGITLATVYKVLDSLASVGLINRVMTSEGIKRYDPMTRNHGHIYCSNTKEILDFYDEELNDMITSFFKKKKFSNLRVSSITLQVSGERVDPLKEVTIK